MTSPRRAKRAISGWVVLNKPFDMTSTQAVGKVRWLFAAQKAGHAGTLDPLATGILPIALGEATKAVPQVQDGTKVYRFAIRWGVATTTDDAEGSVLAESDVRPTAEALQSVLPRFTGTILQKPPAFSAIKIAGERAYDLARAGQAVDIEPREVDIDAIRIVEHGAEQSVLKSPAARAPMSAPSRATSPKCSAPAAMSPCCIGLPSAPSPTRMPSRSKTSKLPPRAIAIPC